MPDEAGRSPQTSTLQAVLLSFPSSTYLARGGGSKKIHRFILRFALHHRLMSNNEPEIILRTPDWIAVQKPSGWLSVPGRGRHDPPVVSHYFRRVLAAETEVLPVHRLDQGTSGVLLFALNREAHKILNGMFERGAVTKHYLAVTQGVPTAQIIEKPIWKIPSRKKNKHIISQKGKPSTTEIRRVWPSPIHPENALVLIRPHTGRPHQIRVHLANEETPIFGDTQYGGPQAARLCLHALRVQFSWNEIVQTVAAPISQDFACILDELCLSAEASQAHLSD